MQPDNTSGFRVEPGNTVILDHDERIRGRPMSAIIETAYLERVTEQNFKCNSSGLPSQTPRPKVMSQRSSLLPFPNHSRLLSLLTNSPSPSQALQIQAQLLLRGLHRRRLPLSKLISFFALSTPPNIPHARLLFSLLSRPNAFIANTMIRAFCRSDSPIDSILLYKTMILESHPLPNSFTYTFLINACAKLPSPELGFQVHCHVVKSGVDLDTCVLNSLVCLYSSFGDVDLARQVFDSCHNKDVVSYNTMIGGYGRVGCMVDALRIFRQMLDLGVWPDSFTFVSVLLLCSELDDARMGKAVHSLACQVLGSDGFNSHLAVGLIDMYSKCGMMDMADLVFRTIADGKDVKAWSSMVSGYARCGKIEEAWKLFEEMPDKDLVAWTALIGGCCQSGRYKEALNFFEEMEQAGLRPDEVTIVTVLSACAQLGALDIGKKLHHYVEGNGLLGRNSRINTAIVDMYCKCGCIQTALDVFHTVDDTLKTVDLLNAIILGLAQHGLGEKAIAIFSEMELLGLVPDEITFVGILCACSHSGLVTEGKEIFDAMVEKYGISQQIEHYGCMVDLLGRGGLLNEAYSFIEKMPVKANSMIFSALLRACRIHRNSKIGQLAQEHLLKLDLDYEESLLLSNLFSEDKKRDYAKKVRRIINYQRKYRPTFNSYIEWNGTVQQFSANDTCHAQSKEINVMLEEMSRRLSFLVYDDITEQMLYDVCKEKNGSVPSRHSEMVALAFGLINLGSATPIKIVTNHRMRSDCHSSLKLLSKIYNRVIKVRDGIRFHQMEHGSCSCTDYW